MGPAAFASLVIGTVAVQLLAAGIGCALAVLVGVMWYRGKSLGPTMGALPIAAVALVALATALLTTADPRSSVDVFTQALATPIAARLMLPAFGGPVVLVVLAASVFEGARHKPRSAVLPLVTVLLALGAAAAVIASGTAVPAVSAFAWVRGIVYAGLGIAAAVALAGPTAHPTSAAAGATGAWAFAWAVALGETSQRALIELMVFFQLPNVELEKRTAFVDKALEVVGPIAPWSGLAIALGIAVGCIGVLRCVRAEQRGTGLLSLVHAPLLVATYLLGSVSPESFVALGTALG